MQFKVHEHSKYPNYLAIVILYQAGQTEILAADVWQASNVIPSDWKAGVAYESDIELE
ncbi:hypothetical protein Gotri_024732 [Gossypium trilobum]|uniref:Expansin-like CBD domain-containing protein n=1 Tax=Gossypium trilobum TaxID=34281 RepID=A0A7J9DN91_9ROSI|nr:hypothetical protein [Gossypium trilobum]